jgi:branched-chain amino acid transport system substrate-binding protein
MKSTERFGVPSIKRLLILIGLVLVVVLGACGDDDDDGGGGGGGGGGDAASEEGPIIIGASISRSGFMAAYDGPPATGVQLAIDDINADGGVLGRQLKYVEENMKTDVAESGNAAARVLDEDASLVITANDFDLGSPAAVEADKQGVVAFSPGAGSVQFGPIGIGPLAFTMGNAAVAQGAAMAQYAYDEKDARSLYVMYNTALAFEVELCEGMAHSFEKLGGTIAGRDTLQESDVELAGHISRIRGLDPQPDAIAVCTPHPQLGSALRQIRAAGIDTPFFGEPGFDGTSWKKAVPDASNVFFPAYGSVFGDDPKDEVNKFVERFEAEAGEPPPGSYALTGYALVEIWAKAVEEAGSLEGEAVANALEGFSKVDSLVGPTSFSDEWHIALDRDVTIMEIQNGETSYVAAVTPEEVVLPSDFKN